jgi:hypothetical protein
MGAGRPPLLPSPFPRPGEGGEKQDAESPIVTAPPPGHKCRGYLTAPDESGLKSPSGGAAHSPGIYARAEVGLRVTPPEPTTHVGTHCAGPTAP